jgi:hypothetical protein
LPPVGEFRWQKPRKLPGDFFSKQREPYDATGFKDSCLQPPSPIPHDPNEHPTVLTPLALLNKVLGRLSVREYLDAVRRTTERGVAGGYLDSWGLASTRGSNG